MKRPLYRFGLLSLVASSGLILAAVAQTEAPLAADAIIGQDAEDGTTAARLDAGGFATAPGRLSVKGGQLLAVDAGNNRVLGWRAARDAANGAPADLVLVQRDFLHDDNYDASVGTFTPAGVSVDGSKRVYVWSSTKVFVFDDPFTTDTKAEGQLAGLPEIVRVVRALTPPTGSETLLAVAGKDSTGNDYIQFREIGLGDVYEQQTVHDVCDGTDEVRDLARAGNYLVYLCSDNQVWGFPLTTTGSGLPDAKVFDTTTMPPATGAIWANVHHPLYTMPGETTSFWLDPTGTSDYALYAAIGGSNGVVRWDGVMTQLNDCFGSDWACTNVETLATYSDGIYGQPSRDNLQGCNRQDPSNTDNYKRGVPAENTLCNPTYVTVDDNDDIWIADAANNRIVRYAGTTASQAQRVLGQPDFREVLGQRLEPDSLLAVTGVAIGTSGRIAIVDKDANRVVIYDSVAALTTARNTPTSVIGQANMFASTANQPDLPGIDLPPAVPSDGVMSQSNLNGPTHVAIGPDNTIYVTDAGNNRVLAYSTLGTSPINASKVYCVENGVYNQNGIYSIGAIAAYGTSLFVAVAPLGESEFNAIVRFDGTNTFIPAMVFGQPNVDTVPGPGVGTAGTQLTNTENYGSGTPGPDTLHDVAALAVDSEGRLWVADRGNKRILWFDNATGADPFATVIADGVLGQPDFSSAVSNYGLAGTTSIRSIEDPEGIAIANNGTLFVVDGSSNRVLRFPTPRAPLPIPNAYPKVAAEADFVFGQRTFSAAFTNAGVDADSTDVKAYGFDNPGPIAATADGRILVVGDIGNTRFLRFANNTAPIITGGGDFEVEAGATLTVQLTVADPDNDPVGALTLLEPVAAGGTISGTTFSYAATGVAPGTEAVFVVSVTDNAARPLSGTTTIRVRVVQQNTPTEDPTTPAVRPEKEIPDNCNNCNGGSAIALVPWLLGLGILRLRKRR